MEGIPSKARNLPMNLLLGKLYRISRHSRAAVAIYKECLRFVKSVSHTQNEPLMWHQYFPLNAIMDSFIILYLSYDTPLASS